MASSILFNRYEMKYWVPDELTRGMSRSIEPFCELDPYARRSPDRRYCITSLYLDSPRYSLFHDTVGDRADRYKLRIRTYGERSEGPITTEVKRKVKDVIVKSRAFLPRDLYPRLFEDPCGARPTFASKEEERHYNDFVLRMTWRHAMPRSLVRYTREAWESTVDEYVRVTFDRQIRYQPASGWDLQGDPRAWIAIDGARENDLGAFCLIEIKCEGTFPLWLQDFVQRFELTRSSYSKYVRAAAFEREDRYVGEGLGLVGTR